MTIKFVSAIGLWALVMATAAVTATSAEPLITRGIGTSGCGQLVDDINPAEGLDNPFNLMLVAWVQGYISAANIALLEDSSRHVDMSALDDSTVLTQMQAFCKANPDRKAVAAVDDLIRKLAKIKTEWEPGTIEWEE